MSFESKMQGPATATRVREGTARSRAAPPTLQICLAVSLVEARRRLLRAAAKRSPWTALVADSPGEFVRNAFVHRASLVWVDIPVLADAPAVEAVELREAAETVCQASSGLLIVSGGGLGAHEERWARSLGAWAYLPEASGEEQLREVFNEAAKALNRVARKRGKSPIGSG